MNKYKDLIEGDLAELINSTHAEANRFFGYSTMVEDPKHYSVDPQAPFQTKN